MAADSLDGGEGVLPISRATIFFDGQYSEPRIHHPEGVAVGPDGAVWCGNAEGDILRIEPNGSRIDKVASTGGFSLGLAFDGDGRLFVCDQRSAAVWRLDLATRALARFTPPGILIPNYPVVDAARNCLYVSDSFGAGKRGPGVWRYDLATGSGDLWWAEPMNFANGMALALDGSALFVIETFDRKVSRIAIGPDGKPAGRDRLRDTTFPACRTVWRSTTRAICTCPATSRRAFSGSTRSEKSMSTLRT